MKKRVAIVTLNHGANYRNKLQNYAVQEVYKKLDYDPITIKYFPEGAKVKTKKKFAIDIVLKKLQKRINAKLYAKNIRARAASFESFNEKYLIRTDKCYKPSDYRTIDERDYDIFSVGSDQVWNSYFYDFSPIYLLDFVEDNSKKIAYAASFGVSDIAPEYKEMFVRDLSKFKAISVREDKAKELVETLCDNKAQVVLDPTLMLIMEEWDTLINDISTEKRYILTYFLGDVSKEGKKIISDYAKRGHLDVIALNDVRNRYYKCDPLKFVALIKNAEVVFTDSFHACCFSLQYKKKFWVVNRISTGREMGSRIDTFLKKFGLEDRRLSDKSDFNSVIDYSRADSVLENERSASWSFLKKAVGEQNDKN